MLTKTLAYLLAARPMSTMGFSGVTASSSVYLPGPGGQAGDGFPLTRPGHLTAIKVWDGTTLRSDADIISFQSGDRLSVYCQNVGANFTVKVRLNGNSTALEIAGIPFSTTLFAIVEFQLNRE